MVGDVYTVVAEINHLRLVDEIVHMMGTERRFLAIVRTKDISSASPADATSLAGVPLGSAARDILKLSGRAMRAREIFDELVRRGYESQKQGGTVAAAVSYALSLRAKTKGDVKRCGKGLWQST